MAPLALILQRAGYQVTGSDLAPSAATEVLKAGGIAVFAGHRPANTEGAALVVRSSAVPDENPEVVRAGELGLRVVKHAEMLGEISRVRRTLAVAGTHGKTTTTAMLATILIAADLDPTVLIGGVLPSLGSGARLGESDLLVAEADEFDRRFLSLHPEIAIVTNVEADHLDYYRTFDAVLAAFAAFAGRVPSDGWLVLNLDSAHAAALERIQPDRTVTYGLGPNAEWRASGIVANDVGGSDFVVFASDSLVGRFRLRVPGRHNVANATAAAVAAGRVGVDFTVAAAALEGFSGVDRRLEWKGEAGGVTVFDDYAHHPTEIRATLAAVREHHPGRIICLFQPHHYHRLSSLFSEFARAFGDADWVVVADVYAPAGRGPGDGERTAADLARAIETTRADYAGDLAAATEAVVALARSGDVILTLGAGDVTVAGPDILRRLRARSA